MSENWKKQRLGIRNRQLERRIYMMRKENERSEEIIRNLENPDFCIFGKREGTKNVNEATLRTKGIAMHTHHGNIEADVGVRVDGKRNDMVSVDISVMDFGKWLCDSNYKKEEYSIVLGHLGSLDEAIALFRGVYLLLKQHQREVGKPSTLKGGSR